MYQIRLKLKLWWDNIFISNVAKKTTKQVSSGGYLLPIMSFLFKAIVMVFFGIIIIFPFYYMIAVSLMSVDETQSTQTILAPKEALWGNFKAAMIDGYWKAVLITSIITATSIILKVFITMLLGYAFSLRNWRFKKISWTFFLSLLMIPEVALLFGQYQVVVSLNIRVGYRVIVALFFPFIASIFSGFMFRNAFEKIPDRTKEAAYIDGTSKIKYFAKIAMPMVSPTTWTVVILTGFAAWNSYMWPSLLLSGTNIDVISTWVFKTAIDSSGGDGRVMQNVRMAAAILAILPMFIVYFVFRRRIMNAVSKQGSAIKG